MENQPKRRRVLSKPLPSEGEGGLFSQSWFPICMSHEVAEKGVFGTTFLDGRVVVFRGEDGRAQVVSAFCPHLGADLAQGSVVGNHLRCPFHQWQFDREGACVQTGCGDPVPKGADLFKFPTVERFGIIWAFNGETPLFELPSFPYPDDELELHIEEHDALVPVDPWVICCNTPDLQHIKVVHGFVFDQGDPIDTMVWTPFSMRYHFNGLHPTGFRVEFDVGIDGTTIFYQSSVFQGQWYGYIAPFGLPRPGQCKVYYIIAVRKSEGDSASRKALIEFAMTTQKSILADDSPVLNHVHFRPGQLTQTDRGLAKFFDYLRSYPRAHPSVDYLR
jgi:phenylpropionate dioxygenase-like ring-hydroxylating dioxygenase large terminal subunit